MILMNPLDNGWVRRHRRSELETLKPAPWRSDPPVSDEPWRGWRTSGGPDPWCGAEGP